MNEFEYRERIALMAEIGFENPNAFRVLAYLLQNTGGGRMAYIEPGEIAKHTGYKRETVRLALVWLSRQRLIDWIEDDETIVVKINPSIAYC